MIQPPPFSQDDFDEITRLNNQLVNMQRQLAKRNAELLRLKNNLEEMVQTRTAALREELQQKARTQETLSQVRARLETIFRVSPLAVMLLDNRGRVQLWNPAAERIFGWSAEEIIGKPNPIVPPHKEEEYRALSERVQQGETLVEQEALRQRKDGSPVTVSISSAAIFDSEGSLTGRMAIFADITQRKQTELALQESEEKFRSVIAQANDGIRLVDENGLICEWNQAMERITGQKRADVMRKPFPQVSLLNLPQSLRTPERVQAFKTLIQKYLQPGQEIPIFAQTEYEIEHVDGSRRVVQTTVSKISTSHGVLVCGILRDVSELKQRQDELNLANQELARAYDLTLEGWARALEMREHETAGHSKRVMELTHRLGEKMGLTPQALAHLKRGALLHDIGKMSIPDSILLKPGKLTPQEWQVMKLHPQHAYDMLSAIPHLQPALDVPYCHHERWDGSGYPRGLRGEEIPFSARIFAVVDVWDALTMDRPYRSAWSEQETCAYLQQEAGSLFDPAVVSAFVKMRQEEQAAPYGITIPSCPPPSC